MFTAQNRVLLTSALRYTSPQQAAEQLAALQVRLGQYEASHASRAISEKRHACRYKKPFAWCKRLAGLVAATFGCDMVAYKLGGALGWLFIGAGIRPEVAAVTHSALFERVYHLRGAESARVDAKYKDDAQRARIDQVVEAYLDELASINQPWPLNDSERQAIDDYRTARKAGGQPVRAAKTNKPKPAHANGDRHELSQR